MSSPAVLVVGTLNIDRVWSVPELPRPGHTVLAGSVRQEFGGKGANQAVAAARQGASVTFVGAVGDDEEGRLYRARLESERIDVAGVSVVASQPTGTAHVYVDPQGEDSIVVSAGANDALSAEMVRAAWSASARPDVLLTQLESPRAAVLMALRLAAEGRVRSVLNAAPAQAGFPWGSVPIDTLIVNEHECRVALACGPAELIRLPGAERRALLRSRQVEHLVVTCGAEPTLHLTADEATEAPTIPVQPVDTVGAGDTFAGVLATRLAENVDWRTALTEANAAAAWSTLAVGAQSAMPTRERITAWRAGRH